MVVLVTSLKGGVGKTTLCAYLGRAFAARGLSTVMVDCDFGVRCLDLLCQVSDEVLFDLGDAAFGRASLERALVKVGDNLQLLAAPSFSSVDSATIVPGLNSVFVQLAQSSDVLLLDTPRDTLSMIADGLGELRRECRALVVVNPGETSIRAAELTGRELGELGIDDANIVINRLDAREVIRGRQPTIIDTIDRTALSLLGAVTDDRSLAVTSRTTDRATLRAIDNIAARLCGETRPLFDGVRGVNRRKLINR